VQGPSVGAGGSGGSTVPSNKFAGGEGLELLELEFVKGRKLTVLGTSKRVCQLLGVG